MASLRFGSASRPALGSCCNAPAVHSAVTEKSVVPSVATFRKRLVQSPGRVKTLTMSFGGLAWRWPIRTSFARRADRESQIRVRKKPITSRVHHPALWRRTFEATPQKSVRAFSGVHQRHRGARISRRRASRHGDTRLERPPSTDQGGHHAKRSHCPSSTNTTRVPLVTRSATRSASQFVSRTQPWDSALDTFPGNGVPWIP
jgi:hypothetical protein